MTTTDDVALVAYLERVRTTPMTGKELCTIFGFTGANGMRDLKRLVPEIEAFGKRYRLPLASMPHHWLVAEGLIPTFDDPCSSLNGTIGRNGCGADGGG